MVLAVVAFSLTGCAETELRAIKLEERPPLHRALAPLLLAGYGDQVTKCQLAIGVIDSPDYEAEITRRGDGPCELDIVVTAPAVTELTPKGLQSLLAHAFGHVERRHATGADRVTERLSTRTDTGHQSVLRTANAQFTPDEEAEADAAAARLLTLAWRGTNVGCLATVDLYEDIARNRRRWAAWLSRHPFPERRVEAVVAACAAAVPSR